MSTTILERTVTMGGPFASRVRVGAGVRFQVLDAVQSDPRPTLVVTHPRLRRLHAAWWRQLAAHRAVQVLDWPEGEAGKDWDGLYRLLTAFHDRGLRRDGRVVAWGGGVLGDLVGLAAALYMRGVACWQVPTTLIAQTDSALGGKTAVDMPWGKNMVGAFYPAQEVFVDPAFLATLPASLVRDGMGEVIKYAVLVGDPFLGWLDRHLEAVLEREPTALDRVVRTCVVYKLDCVAADPLDFGKRRWLNLGHTVGHAVEAASGFRIPHGTAVLVGLLVELQVAMEQLGFPVDAWTRVRQMIDRTLRLPAGALPEPDLVMAAMRADKKRLHASRGLVMALPARPGHMQVLDPVPTERVARALARVFRQLQQGQGT